MKLSNLSIKVLCETVFIAWKDFFSMKIMQKMFSKVWKSKNYDCRDNSREFKISLNPSYKIPI